MMPTLGLLGYGAFSAFMAPHLTPHFRLKAWNRSGFQRWTLPDEVSPVSLAEAAGCDLVVIGVTVQAFDTLLPLIAPHIKSGAMVLDVASVKEKPVSLMLRHLPVDCELIATHPLFGPQSGRNGIAGLTCVLSPVRTTRLACVKNFLADTLGLIVLEKTPQEHDREMAWVQGLTHFIVRAMNELKPPASALATPAYRHLLAVQELLGRDSEELFMTIEAENPSAEGVRRDFMAALRKVEERIQQNK